MPMLGITRSILRCSDAVAVRSCTDSSIRPIRISRIGGIQIVHDGIPLFLHRIPNERNRFREYRFSVVEQHRMGDLRRRDSSVFAITVDHFTIGRRRALVLEIIGG